MNTTFHHPFRIDAPTLGRATDASSPGALFTSSHLPESVRFLALDPAEFTHAYFLLGDQPHRFVNDLSLYLSTVRTFFDRADARGEVRVPATANSDSRRRLSEDLGVGLASFFMVKVFGLTWDSISQIPHNSKLSKKRPDFQGYTPTGRRYLFESKGTTNLPLVEKMMSKALDQVKHYPDSAEAKIAVVSYLSADERFFPSTSFVVDPPALPDEVEPNAETSRFFHFEKVLQFVGLSKTARKYVSTLSHKLKEAQRTAQRGSGGRVRQPRIQRLQEALSQEYSSECRGDVMEERFLSDIALLGRAEVCEDTGIEVYLGADRGALDAGVAFDGWPTKLNVGVSVEDMTVTSVFPDGTVLQLTLLNGSS